MYLNIGFVTQLEFGHNKNRMDPTGCWYSSACMVAYAFEAGPRLGVPELFSRPIEHADGTAGIGHWAMELGWLPTFMKNEHLVKVEDGLPADIPAIQKLLKKWGPMIIYWYKTNDKGQSYGHASVLIGAEDKNIILHDPENAPHTIISLKSFRPKYDHMAGENNEWWPLLRHEGPEFGYKGPVVG
ncbi:papain-like cysteine protease family protein [Pelagibius sp. Alg239-R121]|uniref:papain-like cysteine protease family protein n=1 Tax=Pelagibius sp. Alg239-R121 TaxID=2993448 RepID=UPI0024A646DC|nr:papain-like cysteine protease family protein [Pelagibius sp. Alg239-R121]